MKFARYLDGAQAPEWKRAYLDYRSLKKRITAIRRAQGLDSHVHLSSESDFAPFPGSSLAPAHRSDGQEITDEGHEADDETNTRRGRLRQLEQTDVHTRVDPIELKELNRRADDHNKVTISASPETTFAPPLPNAFGKGAASPKTPETKQSALPPLNASPRDGLRRRTTARFFLSHSGTSILSTPPPTLAQVLEPMSPLQLEFFNKLNAELSKIESFFLEREAEARARSLQLGGQLEELKDHRRLFHDAHPQVPTSFPFLTSSGSKNSMLMSYVHRLLHRSTHTDNKDADITRESRTRHRLSGGVQLDPDEYLQARKQLKRAVLEHYHALEVLNNYRILNITGVRKALKKFEKATGVLVQDLYIKEKVDSCAFASHETVQQLLREMEVSFTARFAKGDRKRALVRLRTVSSHKTHHFSTFRTGLALGLALPAVIDGIIRCLQPHTRVDIPSWASLLFIYANLLVPALLAFIVGANMLIWTASRINYIFIFDLNIRTRLDHREYFEIPSIILATLCWAFWLSFSSTGAPTVQPWTWPMIWLLFVAVLLINPFPVMSRESRWWFLRKVARLLSSGFNPVEFPDFWLGDQFCSLAFPLSNIYFVACSYTRGFGSHPFQVCSRPTVWGVPFLLGILPFVARTGQSIRRWWDSGLITHLINGGKYFTGIVFYFCYQLWRHNGAGHGTSFIFFCLFGTIYSTYGSAWDLLMDWSVLRPHARYMFLREELLYPGYIPFYYLAIITNVVIRFIWVIYIPTRGPSAALRTWIAALLEVLRRCQWNVYRLENEHLGNVDQYRITREVPLPYSFDDEILHETDVGDEDDIPKKTESVRSSKSKQG